MKFALTFLSFLLVADTCSAGGKEPSKAKSPTAVYNQDSSARLVPLESQIIRIKYEFHALGFAGGTTVYLVGGPRSPVRLIAKPELDLVAELDGRIDPLEAFWFFQFDQVNSSRVAPLSNFNMLGRSSEVTMNAGLVDFNAVKQGVSSFKIIPTKALAHGEYCSIVRDKQPFPKKGQGFCFGVDASQN
jgi:hypothetical protein